MSIKFLNKRAFTMLEMIFALFILALVMQLLMSLTTSSLSIYQVYVQDNQGKFNHFLNLLDRELDHYQDYRVTPQRMVMYHKETSAYANISVVNQKIAKGPGHQILLYQVKSWQLQQFPAFLWVQVQFTNDQVFQGWVELHEE